MRAGRQVCSTSYATSAPQPSSRVLRLAPRVSLRHTAATVVPRSTAHEEHAHPDPSHPPYPTFQEEKDVSHEAFMHAMEAARPRAMRIPGMQEFAASLWARRRSIPSQTYSDPLDHIFTEFDTDNDGKLSAADIAKVLASRGVEATEEQVQMFIESSDADHDHLVSRKEFAPFIFHMASADLRSVSTFASAPTTSTHIIAPLTPPGEL